MNRYRSVPGLGPQKASASTTCQKCLKKDSYECKSSTQERPYSTRPSRTQQLLNPRLKPQLTNEAPNDLVRKEGIADEQLARTRAQRLLTDDTPSSSIGLSNEMIEQQQRSRSRSRSSIGSVSTVSTDRSESTRPAKRRMESRRDHRVLPRLKKRRYRDTSQSSHSGSPPLAREPDIHKSRRFSDRSPLDRGRPEKRSDRPSQSRSPSVERNKIGRYRRSPDFASSAQTDRAPDSMDVNRSSNRDRRAGRASKDQSGGAGSTHTMRKERSMSPYSRRLALTQAMNMGQ